MGEVHARLRLDRFLKVIVGGASEKFVDRAIRAGCVSYNGRVVRNDQAKAFYVKTGGTLDLKPLPATMTVDLEYEEWTSRILFEDDCLIAINKPAGLASAPAPAERTHAVSALEDYMYERDRDGTILRNVHRLDKDTSGVLLLAKSAAVATQLGALFKSNSVSKMYWALLSGKLEGPEEGLWSDRLDLGTDGKSHILPPGSEEGKTAKTRFSVEEVLGGAATVVHLRPSTGRMHQLRAQSASRGAPIAGDDRYGRTERSKALAPPRLCLHCAVLEFSHPLEKERVLKLEAPLPAELAAHLAAVRKVVRSGGGSSAAAEGSAV